MSKPRQEPSVESLIGLLRDEVEEIERAPRRRMEARLTVAVLLQIGAALLPSFLSHRFFRSKAFAVSVALPVGMVLGASGYAALHRDADVAERRDRGAEAGPSHERRAALPEPLPNAQTATATSTEPAPTSVSPSSLPPAVAVPPPVVRSRAPRVFLGRDILAPNRELSQLEKARTLLSEGKVDATLAQVRKHVISYPHSALEQERQALYIKALVAADRMIEARVRAAAFVKRFPHSTLRGSVEKAVAVDSVMVR